MRRAADGRPILLCQTTSWQKPRSLPPQFLVYTVVNVVITVSDDLGHIPIGNALSPKEATTILVGDGHMRHQAKLPAYKAGVVILSKHFVVPRGAATTSEKIS